MSTRATSPVLAPASGPRLASVVTAVCERIAPAWPLDRFIAVNPLWGRIDEPLPRVAARVAALSGASLTMDRAWYREQWDAGRFGPEHVREALRRTGSSVDPQRVIDAVHQEAPVLPVRDRVTEVLDGTRDTGREMPWSVFVVDRISRHCAAWFSEGRTSGGAGRGLYDGWRTRAAADRGPRLMMGLRGFREAARQLPGTAEDAIATALDALGVPAELWEDYLTALLLDVQGWASWCAYRRFTAQQSGHGDDTLTELLAIRIGWEWLLLSTGDDALRTRWAEARAQWTACDAIARAGRVEDWVLQRAFEIATHAPLVEALSTSAPPERTERPAVQAAFCIDVRSEVLRRALESASDDEVQTLGFAGFFGLPAVYRAVGSNEDRPQLPGPLAPRVRVEDTGVDTGLAGRRRQRVGLRGAWKRFTTTGLSGFSFVESVGMFFGPKLLTDAAGWTRPVTHPERVGLTAAEHRARAPRLVSSVDGEPLSVDERCELAEGILRGLGLTGGHARLVALVGHGSQTVNNPLAAGLDCGACCGQSGESNARAVAALLNDPAVRAGLAERGIDVPDDTWFVPGHHDTTTDDVALYDTGEVPASHITDLDQLRAWLGGAGEGTRRERAPDLGLCDVPPARVTAAVRRRARDWAQVRPEWGLAGNSSFVVAPRSRTRHLDLQGRAFLHDYRWQDDEDFSVLELLLTAPMVVTHWINFQYYASTVDNRRFGSGNKVLHNVVGGRIGVFEGNGGDLRTGLALQSLHDGRRWVHEPVRLGVFVQAPREAIARIIDAHDVVRNLVDHGWVHLHQLDDDGGVWAWEHGRWEPLA